ncbi:phosphatidate cytidylyltransferase [Proteiniclasticum sp. SCR006]|uniref:Phosphatidate cytidylyltransferase n=1 Tax=Proteiniclasticum aestuarii TaxID=2817862 RepID=A0A939H901_9CLOT|nr:phosphatidate cytidylyltransferase [Proteiniclasticum aestuarii]
MNSRYLGALVLIPILALLLVGGWFLKITVLFLSIRALYEYFHVLEKKGHKPVRILGYAAWLGYFLVLLFTDQPQNHLSAILAILLAVGFVYMVFSEEVSIADIGITIAGVLYTVVLFGFLVLLSEKENGQYYVYSVFIISWVCDTLAYYSGRLFGRHKLIERVSPKKTVEGAVGGLFGGAVGAFVLGTLIAEISGISPWHFLLMGFMGAVFGQIGDLAASAIKRYAGEKDYPKIIPGHGGILDRFDSILFVSLIVYVYTSYVIF